MSKCIHCGEESCNCDKVCQECLGTGHEYIRDEPEDTDLCWLCMGTGKPKVGLWKPEEGDVYYFVASDGVVERSTWEGIVLDQGRLAHYNIFPTREMAEKASTYQCRATAIISACLQVDPDFEPEWSDTSQNKFYVFYDCNDGRWLVSFAVNAVFNSQYVSTRKKAEEVCAILKAEGIK